ncbi:MAG: response regulator, partial [Bacteroidetes bacterium]|nr:response regulator [Bacteroidota bacterium]
RYGFMWFATDDGLNKFDGTGFTVYRHRPGDSTSLRVNEILALHEDREGNLWVGTSGGAVSLYDRKRDLFINFPTAADTGLMVPNVVIRSICSDYLGNIWLAQYEYPYVIDPKTRRMTRLDLIGPGDKSRGRISLICMLEDSHRRLWIGTDKGLFLYQRETRSFRRFLHDSSNHASLPDDYVRALAEDKKGRLWVGTEEGLCVMHSGMDGFTSYQDMDSAHPVPARGVINAIASDQDGLLWVGTMRGLFAINPDNGHVQTYLPDESNLHSLTSKAIKCIYIDKQGIYWFGTYRGGINKYDKNLNLFNLKLSDAFHENGSRSSIVTSFANRKDGKLWVGTDGGGLYIFDPATDQLKHYDIVYQGRAVPPLSILSLHTARSNELYIGTYANGLYILDPVSGKTRHLTMGAGKNDLNANDFYSIKEDSRGRIWLGTNGAGINVLENGKVIAKYTPHPVTSNDLLLPVNGYIRALEEDRNGNMWIGTHGSGIAVCNSRTGAFTVFDKNRSNLPSDKVQSLLLDHLGRMWVGTYGEGLCLFDDRSASFKTYSEKDGLQNTTIYDMQEDASGHIWVSNNTGISSLDVDKGIFRNYTTYNGTQNNNFVHGSGIKTPDGRLFFGGLQGFNYFNSSGLTFNRNVPVVVMTDLKIANKSVIPGADAPIKEHINVTREIRLAFGQNFALSFVALDYTLPRQNHYAYKLDGFDKDWIYTGSMNTAYYTNLDPGEYTFRVKASNNDGVWSNGESTVKIYVRPPFWRTTYAYIFYILLAGGLLLYSRYRSLRRIRKKYEMEQERQEVMRVQELDRLKLKFLTNLSHEFRTPISLIMGPVDQLLGTHKEGPSADKLRMIRRNARRLLNLVSQLLDFRKMEEQELKLQLTAGDLVGFVKDIFNSFTDLSERKNISFDFVAEPDRLYVLFDPGKMERILFNLLSNAFKFTLEGGSITLTLSAEEEAGEEGTRWVSVRVIDTGIGIPPESLEKIFESFFQHSTPAMILNQGTGIGLSIAREFARLHGGTITASSRTTEGSVFTVRLPLRIAEVQPEPVTEHVEQLSEQPAEPLHTDNNVSEDADQSAEMPVVLLIEDNEDFRFYLKDNLRQHYKVLEAADGKEGWQKALSGHPHLIVSDISMPQMDGISLARKLKADKRTSHIPIILLTALTGEGRQMEGLDSGANDYITKPFSTEVLNAKIRNLLDLRNILRTTFTRQLKVVGTEIKLESEDEKLMARIVEYIEANLNSPQLSVENLSRQIGMSRSSLYSRLLEITGQTPVEFIRSFKLDKAIALLEKGDLTIAEVAYHVGFSTSNYFARAFKAKFNMLPSEYAARSKKGAADSDQAD